MDSVLMTAGGRDDGELPGDALPNNSLVPTGLVPSMESLFFINLFPD